MSRFSALLVFRGMLSSVEIRFNDHIFISLGSEDSTDPYTKPDPKNSATRSQFLADEGMHWNCDKTDEELIRK